MLMKRNFLLAAVCGAVIITSCGKVEKPAEEREDCTMQEWKDFSFTCIKEALRRNASRTTSHTP